MAWQRDDAVTSPLTPKLGSPFLPSPGSAASQVGASTSSAYAHGTHAVYAYPAPASATYSFSATLASRIVDAQNTPSRALVNANAPHTRYVRLKIVQQGVGCADVLAAGEGGRVAVGGKDVLKIIKFTNRIPATPIPSSPSSPPPSTPTSNLVPPQPVQRSLSDRGHSRRGKSKVVGPGGSTAEEVLNVWSGSKLSLVHGLQDVAWGHQNYSEKLVTAHVQGDCILWDLQKTGSKVETFLHEHARGRGVVRVEFSPRSSQLVLSGSIDGTCKLWDLRKPMNSVSTFRCNAAVSSICFSPVQGSSDFVAGLGNGAIQRFDYRMGDKGMVDWVSSAHSGAVQDLKWRDSSTTSADDSGTWLASCGMDTLVKVWDMDPASNTPSLTGAPGGNSYGSFATTSTATASMASYSSGSALSSASVASSSNASTGVPYNKPKQVLRTPTPNRRVCWRPGVDTELVVVPYSKYGVAEADEEGDSIPEEARIAVWDVRRNYVPKYILHGGTGAPRDVLFFESEPDALIATYHNSYVVQHDFRHHTTPITVLPRGALSWDGSGRLAFAAEDKQAKEIPFDEPPYDAHTRLRLPSGKEHNVRGPRFAPTNQVAAGILVPGTDADAFCRMARGYVLDGAEQHELCAANAKVAREAGNIQAAQAWQMLYSLLVPIPLPSRSPSPMATTPGQRSSKFSYSPLSGGSRRATSAGPRPRSKRGPSSRQLARPRAPRRATVAADATETASNREAAQRHGEGALEDSDSEGDAGDERDPEGSDVPVSPVETRASAEDASFTTGAASRGHTRNHHSESSVSSGGIGNSMRSPLSRTPVTADTLGVSSLRRLSEMTEDDEENAGGETEGIGSVDGQTDDEAGNENEPGSSSSAAEGGLMLRRGKPANRIVTRHYGQFHSSHGTRRNSMESDNANGSFVRGHRKTTSNGSGSTQINPPSRQARVAKKLSTSPAPMEPGEEAALKLKPRRSRREVVEAEERIRQKGWQVMRTIFEGMMLEGDVQTCAVMGIVTGTELVDDRPRVVDVVMAYLDLLSRLQLYTAAAEVRKYFRAPQVQDSDSHRASSRLEVLRSQTGAQFDASCARCRKALRGDPSSAGNSGQSGHHTYCKNCKRVASRCAICHLPSKGLFFLCPTCGHGGHGECYRSYYLSHPMDFVPVFPQATPVLPPHTLRGSRHSVSITDSTVTEEDDRSGRATNPKRLRRGPGRVHPVEAADDTDDEAQKGRFWERKRRVGRKVLTGHPCVAGCGHVCWASNDLLDIEGSK